jgi:hypothetical protein
VIVGKAEERFKGECMSKDLPELKRMFHDRSYSDSRKLIIYQCIEIKEAERKVANDKHARKHDWLALVVSGLALIISLAAFFFK